MGFGCTRLTLMFCAPHGLGFRGFYLEMCGFQVFLGHYVCCTPPNKALFDFFEAYILHPCSNPYSNSCSGPYEPLQEESLKEPCSKYQGPCRRQGLSADYTGWECFSSFGTLDHFKRGLGVRGFGLRVRVPLGLRAWGFYPKP